MKHIAVLLIISSVFISACTGTKWVRTSVVKEYDFAVALEQHPNKEAIAQQKQARAKRVELTDLKRFLADLSYVEKGGMLSKGTQAAVFQSDEIDRLAPVVMDSLSKADATQRVRFLSFSLAKGVLFSSSRKTEGVIFVSASGQLNIAFNYVNSNRMPSETSAIYMNFSDADPLNIQSADIELVTSAPYLQPHKFEAGKTAPLWVLADLDKLAAAILSAPTPAAAESAPPVKTPTVVSPAVVPVTAPSVTPAEQATAVPAGEDSLRREVKTKLKYLKELYDEGLISEKDYQNKKQEVLDKIH